MKLKVEIAWDTASPFAIAPPSGTLSSRPVRHLPKIIPPRACPFLPVIINNISIPGSRLLIHQPLLHFRILLEICLLRGILRILQRPIKTPSPLPIAPVSFANTPTPENPTPPRNPIFKF